MRLNPSTLHPPFPTPLDLQQYSSKSSKLLQDHLLFLFYILSHIYWKGGNMKTNLKSLICGFLVTAVFVSLQSCKGVHNMEYKPAREQIVDVVNGVVISVDRSEWETCKSYFIDEPFIDYSSLSGQPGSKVKAVELVKGWSDFLSKLKFTQHFITNHDVKINGNTATCYSYVRGIHSLPYAEGGELCDVYGTYEHELVFRPSGWK